MEVVAVSSAIYGLVLSMIICITAVAIFTGHVTLLLIIVFTILGKNILFFVALAFKMIAMILSCQDLLKKIRTSGGA